MGQGREMFAKQRDLYKKTIKKALDSLNKENVTIIVHGPSFPSIPDEDTGTGSPYSSGAERFYNFLEDIGFNSVQLGPSGKTKKNDPSPYTSTIFSDNTLFIDLKALTTDQWLGLLSLKTYKSVVDQNKQKNSSILAYEYIYNKQDEALREAWAHYKKLCAIKNELYADKQKSLEEISAKFLAYKELNKEWLDNDALYEVLACENESDYWPDWQEVDRYLPVYLSSKDEIKRQQAAQRLEQIYASEILSDEIEYYKFCQFIVNEQRNQVLARVSVKTLADIQVTYSDRDWWAFQNLFLDDYYLGVPPDYFSIEGQAWGFPVIDPDKILDKDSNGNPVANNGRMALGDSGKLIKKRFDKMFKDNPGGVRIDHIVGLIDPWVYPRTANTAMVEDGGCRLYSSPEKEVPFAKWAIISEEDINPEVSEDNEARVLSETLEQKKLSRYATIVDIIINSAKDNGVPVSNIICEDLGTLTNPVAAVLKERNLSGLRVTQFVNPEDPDHMYRVKNTDAVHWAVIGTHDNDTLLNWVEQLIKEKQLKQHAQNLAEDLKVDQKDLLDDKNLFITAKFAEVFACPAKNVQIMFSDVFGIDQRYNNPGCRDAEQLLKNWRVRVPNNFEDFYFNQLQKGLGLNFPKALALAIRSKGKTFVAKNKDVLKDLDMLTDSLNGKGKLAKAPRLAKVL